MTPDPAQDGITHINIYSQGKTELGRLLSNFAHTPFEHTEYGKFASVEGLWYWLLTGEEFLREMSGYRAKEVGRKILRKGNLDLKKFEEDVKEGIRCKLRQHQKILKLLTESTLPLEHYYAYGGHVKEPTEHRWIIEEIERIRKIMQLI